MKPKKHRVYRREFAEISEKEEETIDRRLDEDDNRELERSLSSVDELEDFEKHDSNDLVYREYEPLMLPDLSQYQRFDRLGEFSWKTGRPKHWRSLLDSIVCVLQTSFVAGVILGLMLTIVIYLDINLADICYSYREDWRKIPGYIRKIRMMSSMVASATIQSWHFLTLLLVFGWSTIKKTNILSWNILASLTDGVYKIFIAIFVNSFAAWHIYPSYALFATITMFNSIKVATHLNSQVHSVTRLAFQLMAQFIIGIPVALVFMLWINPMYKGMESVGKVVFASFVPLITALPKMFVRKSAQYMYKLNHPGRSVYLLTAMYTAISLLYRMLQIQVNEFAGYIILSIIFGILCTLERATLPYLDFLQHRFFGGKKKTMTEFMTPKRNRLMSDLTLLNMVTEPASIIVSCAAMALFQYYYAHDTDGNVYDGMFLLKVALTRVSAALAVEIFFNVISLKVESYYFNMPVMRVWRLKRCWILFTLLLNGMIAIMCFSHVFYDAISTPDVFDGTLICSPPFQRPYIKMQNLTKAH